MLTSDESAIVDPENVATLEPLKYQWLISTFAS